MREIERRIGRKLTEAERRLLHDEISKQNLNVDDIIEIGEDLFGVTIVMPQGEPGGNEDNQEEEYNENTSENDPDAKLKTTWHTKR